MDGRDEQQGQAAVVVQPEATLQPNGRRELAKRKGKAPLDAAQLDVEIRNRNSWLVVGTVVALLVIVAVKVWQSPNGIDLSRFDFNTLLGLILALFSIWLSVTFYHKATEQSNRFYDDTNKFTGHVSELLGRIEAGFGEKLTSLHHGQERTERALRADQEAREKQQALAVTVEEQQRLIHTYLRTSTAGAPKATDAEAGDEAKDAFIEQLRQSNAELERKTGELADALEMARRAEEETHPRIPLSAIQDELTQRLLRQQRLRQYLNESFPQLDVRTISPDDRRRAITVSLGKPPKNQVVPNLPTAWEGFSVEYHYWVSRVDRDSVDGSS